MKKSLGEWTNEMTDAEFCKLGNTAGRVARAVVANCDSPEYVTAFHAAMMGAIYAYALEHG